MTDELNQYFQNFTQAYLASETDVVQRLKAPIDSKHDALDQQLQVENIATQWVEDIRANVHGSRPLDEFLAEYNLSNREGVILMCLAEALLRIPDTATMDRLIDDKLRRGDWASHLSADGSWLVNASTWALAFTGKMINLDALHSSEWLHGWLKKTETPVVRIALQQAMSLLGQQFIAGENIVEALKNSKRNANAKWRYSYDMLGEAAITEDDATHYYNRYCDSIDAIARRRSKSDLFSAPSISVKLSALHPRYEYTHKTEVMQTLVARLAHLVEKARDANIGLTVDAEEADRLNLSLSVITAVLSRVDVGDWQGFGMAVQAYQKRAWYLLDYLANWLRLHDKRICLRLVKGAYWDTEIKRAQQQGLIDYPVFTSKHYTDVSYMACARYLLANRDVFFPQFATHNARNVADILVLARDVAGYEFQRLHGMGEALYDAVSASHDIKLRVYAPVGDHQTLLPYLVRRLLENGANSSFVHQVFDASVEVGALLKNPLANSDAQDCQSNARIPLPAMLFGEQRLNSLGLNLDDEATSVNLEKQCQTPSEASQPDDLSVVNVSHNPAHPTQINGFVSKTPVSNLETKCLAAHEQFSSWQLVPVHERASILERAADLFQDRMHELIRLCVLEAGKTIPDAVGEVREAIDFCRYYAALARSQLTSAVTMAGPVGEANYLSYEGRGVFVCISPWNFPLAIFVGQVVAALVSGNTVVAKPALQTPLLAVNAIKILHEAGVPIAGLQGVYGPASEIGDALVTHPCVAGIAFTGSTATARHIYRKLAAGDGAIIPLIAETGGQNAMIADSSALAEQLVVDAMQSAFNSAGQRCSALRVLYVQSDIYARVKALLIGAMATLAVGDPSRLATDVGPVIDDRAQQQLQAHIDWLSANYEIIAQTPIPTASLGSFVSPTLAEIPSIKVLEHEVFGPILHLIPYQSAQIDQVIADINQTGYGLTLGIHSRIDSFCEYVRQRTRVGNIYVNRNLIGAAVGVQPFGGQGLSGTGPKAGGPNYLQRFIVEKTTTINTAAIGGDPALLGT